MKEYNRTLSNQKVIKSNFIRIMSEKGYVFYTENEFKKLEYIPNFFVLENSKYIGIYGTQARSPFKVVNYEKSISERIEITYQKSSGSVDEKFPYLYLNSALSHDDSVVLLIDGGGYKKKARDWLKKQIEGKWLNQTKKEIKIFKIGGFFEYVEKNY